MSRPSTLAGSATLSLLTLSILWAAGPRDQSWQQVDEAVAAGKPRTAINLLEPIIKQAMEEKQYDEAIKAIVKQVWLEGEIEGNKPEERITRLETEIEQARPEMKPAMEGILANWYWQYFQQNRWRFAERTQTSKPPGEDFTTWDLQRLFAEIERHLQVSLADSASLKQIPVAEFDHLLEKGNAPDSYRPTLFDILAYNALDFYKSGEQAAAQVYDAFELTADSPIFGSAADFIQWQPQSDDEAALTLKAVRLYQRLLEFHQDDSDPSAFLDTDLDRLVFGKNQSTGDEKSARYHASLRRFADEHADHPISSRALHELALSLHQQEELSEAHKIASEGLRRHEQSVGGRRCYNLIQQIEAKSLQVSTERVWNEPSPTIDVAYRNLTEVHFRLVSVDFNEFIRSGRARIDQFTPPQLQQLRSARAVRSWSETLPPTEDFQQRIVSLPCPDDLAPGPYLLIASHRADFAEGDNVVSRCEVWRSDLALVLRNHPRNNFSDGFVLDANSGNPISGAVVRAWKPSNNQPWVEIESRTTDRDGRFEFRSGEANQAIVLATHAGHSLSSTHQLYARRTDADRTRTQTLFFTDRAIYRPGQSIHFKGICLSVNQKQDNYRILSSRKLVVALQDVNGKEVERIEARTNDYGSFSGTVTAPRDRVTGRMRLSVIEGPRGAATFSVEEYKRPKFQVEIDPPEEPAKLAREIAVQGSATAYTGAPIGGAKVQWRVVREVRFPDWWLRRSWRFPPIQQPSQEIAHGVSTTGADGTFTIRFDAKPDPEAPRESEPIFRFSINADVTDSTGETRSSSRVVKLGYSALVASLTAGEWLSTDKPVEIHVQTKTINGDPGSAKGQVTIFAVEQPDQVVRPALDSFLRDPFGPVFPREPKNSNPSNPDTWPLGAPVHQADFETDATGTTTISAKLPVGMYRVRLTSADAFEKEVTAELPITVIDPDANNLAIKVPEFFASEKETLEPGEEYLGVWGSGYESARVFVEVEHRGKVLQRYWTKPDVTQTRVTQAISDRMRGGFHVRTTMVRENRAYTRSHYVEIPWSNKELNLKWERFVSKLEPGAKEVWTAIVSAPDSEGAVAEMVATLYDASLDAFRSHDWPTLMQIFRREYSRTQIHFENQLKYLRQIIHDWSVDSRDGSLVYRSLPFSQSNGLYSPMAFGMEMADDMRGMGGGMGFLGGGGTNRSAVAAAAEGVPTKAAMSDEGVERPQPDLSVIAARQNLNETAFFFPHLVSAADGTVRMEFTMPEALTEWSFLGFAHDRQLRSGLLRGTTVTAKDLMVQPNPPRFLREGDEIEFTVKVSNQSPTRQSGSVRLNLSEARTGDPVDELVGNINPKRDFDIAAGQSTSIAWRLSIPDGLGFLTYRAVGSTGRLSDGEEGLLPVLSRRVLVTESLPLPIRGQQEKEFRFDKLIESADSDTLRHQSVTLQMVSNPSWYAVMALPYLMEYPHQCSEQTFNRLYANSLARHLAQSDPKIERVFEQWRATPTLDSPLEKNEQLKSVLIEETPWVRQAERESQSRRNVGLLFENNRLDHEMSRAIDQLSQMQLEDGRWPWFPGGSGNDYITLYITTGFGRLRHLGVNIDVSPAVKSLARLDRWMKDQHDGLKPAERKTSQLTSALALYLYGRSFFLDDQPIAAEHREAWEFWISQAKSHWTELGNRQSQAHVAIALKRVGDLAAAKSITNSLKERSVSDEEMGMFWRDTELSWWWYRAPIETQAMMIEVFDEVADDQQAVEDCKAWLLKQKQTQDWKTTKATADAVYALLLRGQDRLVSDTLVSVSIGGQSVPIGEVEAGTGFVEHRWTGREVEPSFGEIQVSKSDPGIAWGSLHWQYLEEMSKVTSHTQTPLKLTKELFVKQYTDAGPQLHAVDGPVAVGDELVVRLVLRSDRDMEYVHLKDYRGSGTEPVNVFSQYDFRDGLAYYESTRDTASHFFIDYLPKGTYVFEYSTRVQLRGTYQTGFANIQCMYAPEFNSHSESLQITVE